MKRQLSLIFILIFATLALAQKTVSGTIKDADGAVSNASVTVEEPGKDAILAYGITNAKGEYHISFTSSQPNVNLKVKAYNHKLLIQSIPNEAATHNFNLEGEATEIKEVKLKAKIITKKGDTISYDIKAFENKADRTLADVMKKIPGVDVNPDGTILYQGNPINKFYVNGKDLMEGSYGTISNSLPKDAVQKVEVLENHQPVKILQDKVPSDAAAINIKLKNAVTMTGRGEVGAGFGAPALWNVKLTPMFFGQKSQWVLNYKTNNVGETVENEGNILAFGSRWEGPRSQASQNSWLDVESAGTPSVPEKRYLFNNVHFLSANYLTNPFKNKEWELKANANYTNNAVSRESYVETNTYLSGQTIHSVRTIRNNFYTDKAKGELIFTKNAKKGFFKNVTTFTQYWNADRADANISVSGSPLRYGQEALQSPTTSFKNSLSTIIPWKEKLVNLMSYISYQNDRQNLVISPATYPLLPVGYDAASGQFSYFNFGANTSSVLQNFGMKSFIANHSANVSLSHKNWMFTPEVGLNYSSNSVNTQLLGATPSGDIGYGSPYENDIHYTNTVPYASFGINYKSDSWNLFSSLPVNFNSIRATDPLRSVDKSLTKTTFEPNLYLQYSFASFWKASANANINYNFADINNLYSGWVLTSPTSFSGMSPNNPILQTNAKSAGVRIEYRNPLNNLFFNVGYRYSNTLRNLIAASTANGYATQVSYLEMDNHSGSNGFSAEIGKYFPKYKTNASVSYGNTQSTSQSLRNGQLFDSSANTQNIGFKFNNSYFSWLSVDYNMTYIWRVQNSILGTDMKTSGYNHNLAVFVYPAESHTLGFNWDQVNSANAGTTFHNAFFDASYQYSWVKRKVDFELKLLNIANRKVFEIYSASGYQDSYTRYQLRPRSLMFTVKFNFK